MHLIEQLALSTGVKIGKPFIETSYYPLSFDKYIVLENGSEVKSRAYGMWADIITEMRPHLNDQKIAIIQIGDAKDELIVGDLQAQSLEEIWTSEKTKKIRNSMYDPEKMPDICKKCEVYVSIFENRLRTG